MKLGLMFVNSGPFSNPALLTHLATTAERCGIESLWTVEHVVIPQDYKSPYPYSSTGKIPGGEDVSIPDPLLPLAFVAAVTKKVKLATGVLILPQRHPLYVAKEAATLDQLSNGRAILGIGSGWLEEEFTSLGLDFHRAALAPTRRSNLCACCGTMMPHRFTASISTSVRSSAIPSRCKKGASRFTSEAIRLPQRNAQAATATASSRRWRKSPSSRNSSR